MAFEKIKVSNPIVEMDGEIPSLADHEPIALSRRAAEFLILKAGFRGAPRSVRLNRRCGAILVITLICLVKFWWLGSQRR
jgi:hypothetical protein